MVVKSRFVLTLVSPSPTSSIKARDALMQWFKGIETISETNSNLILGVSSIFQPHFHSLFLELGGMSLNFLSPQRSASGGRWSLLALQECSSAEESRSLLASALSTRASLVSLQLLNFMRRPFPASSLLGNGGDPLLQLRTSSERALTGGDMTKLSEGTIKEIAIPIKHQERSSLPSFCTLFRNSDLNQPAVGLYQLPGSPTCVRPIPGCAKDDGDSLPLSIVIHVDSLSRIREESSTERDLVPYLIGSSGIKKRQQLLLRHESLFSGVDLRVCESTEHSPFFNEAQESLLAASLPGLQSTEVMENTATVDPRTNNADCWIEFRENIRKPITFLGSNTKPATIARPPSIKE